MIVTNIGSKLVVKIGNDAAKLVIKEVTRFYNLPFTRYRALNAPQRITAHSMTTADASHSSRGLHCSPVLQFPTAPGRLGTRRLTRCVLALVAQIFCFRLKAVCLFGGIFWQSSILHAASFCVEILERVRQDFVESMALSGRNLHSFMDHSASMVLEPQLRACDCNCNEEAGRIRNF